MNTKKTYLLLLLIIALGLYLRVVNINHTPPGVYPDEAVNGMDAVSALHGHWQWFYPANNGREGLFMNMIAVCFKFFGVSPVTLRLPAITFGTLTIWGIYLLGAELFQNRRLGLLSAFLIAVAFWAINFSRIAFRAILLPADLVFAFYFLFRGVRRKSWVDFAIGGFIFGLGLHTYIAFRIAPLILVVMLPILMLTRENFLKEYWKLILVFCVAAFATASPMLYTFFIAHPEYWQSRTSEISIFNPKVNHGHFALALLRTLGLGLAKYNFWGDQNWRQNFPPYPILDPLTGLAFLIALIYSIGQFFRLLTLRFTRKIRDQRLEIYAFLLSSFFIMLIPEVLADEGNPHALRSIGTMPAVFILAAMTFNFFWDYARERPAVFKKVTASILFLMLVSIGVFNGVKYELVWAKEPQTAQAFDKNSMDMADYLKTRPADEEKFVVAESMNRIPIKLFNLTTPNVHYVYHSQATRITPKNQTDFIIILTDNYPPTIATLKNKFPQLTLQKKTDNLGASFWIMK